MHQKSIKNDLETIIYNIQLLKYILDVFFTLKFIFPEKNSRNFRFLTICCIALRVEGVYRNLNFSQKVAIAQGVGGGLRPPCRKFDLGDPHIKKSLLKGKIDTRGGQQIKIR